VVRPGQRARLAGELPKDRDVLVYCVYGHEVGRSTAMKLRAAGVRARFLPRGHRWLDAGGSRGAIQRDAGMRDLQAPPRYTLWQLVGYMGLGTWGFGGPVALVGFMYRDLVERWQWVSEAEYKEGMALAQLMPGPLAAQLAIYLGYVHHRVLGTTLVGVAFVLPSFLMVVAIGAAYQAYGGISWMQAVFYGVGASVIGIIAMSAWKRRPRTSARTSCCGPSSRSAWG
jgi:chromate transport protein ChrA